MDALRRFLRHIDPDLQPAVVAMALVIATSAGLAFSAVA